MSPRNPTDTEGIEESFLAKKARDARAAEQLAIPHEVDDPATGVVARGPKLDARRAKRGTDGRVLHLEHRVDDLLDKLMKRDEESAKRRQQILLQLLAILSAIALGVIGAKGLHL